VAVLLADAETVPDVPKVLQLPDEDSCHGWAKLSDLYKLAFKQSFVSRVERKKDLFVLFREAL
jgi:hypothetical protein